MKQQCLGVKSNGKRCKRVLSVKKQGLHYCCAHINYHKNTKKNIPQNNHYNMESFDNLIDMRNLIDRTIFRIYLCDTLDTISQIINHIMSNINIVFDALNGIQISSDYKLYLQQMDPFQKLFTNIMNSNIDQSMKIKALDHFDHLFELLKVLSDIQSLKNLNMYDTPSLSVMDCVKYYIRSYYHNKPVIYTVGYILQIFNSSFINLINDQQKNHIITSFDDLDNMKNIISSSLKISM